MVVLTIEAVAAALAVALTYARTHGKFPSRSWGVALNLLINVAGAFALAMASSALAIAIVLEFVSVGVNWIVVNSLLMAAYRVGHLRHHRADLAHPAQLGALGDEVVSGRREAEEIGFDLVDGTAHVAAGGHGTSVLLLHRAGRALELISGPAPHAKIRSTTDDEGLDLVTLGVGVERVLARHVAEEVSWRAKGRRFVSIVPERIVDRTRTSDLEAQVRHRGTSGRRPCGYRRQCTRRVPGLRAKVDRPERRQSCRRAQSRTPTNVARR